MKIESVSAELLRITDIMNSHRLDNLTVLLQDFEPGRGQLTITCYGRCWTAFWGGMGIDLRHFILACHAEYLVDNLVRGMPAMLKQAKAREEDYLLRIVKAVQDALRQQLPQDGVNQYSQGPVWNAFGLTYARYAVFPRRTLQSMPWAWQDRFVGLIDEAHAHLPEGAFGEDYTVLARKAGKFAKDPLAEYRHTGPIKPKQADLL